MKEGKIAIPLVLIILMAFEVGCTNPKEDEIAAKIQTIIRATRYKISHNRVISTKDGDHRAVELYFDGVSSQSLNNKVASSSAYYFFKEAPPETMNYDQVKIILDDHVSKFEKSYTIQDIELIDSIDNFPLITFFDWHKTDSLKYIIDTSIIRDSDLKILVNSMRKIDSVEGNITDVSTIGFYFTSVKAVSEPVVGVWIDVKNGRTLVHYKFLVTKNSRKIVDIQIDNLALSDLQSES